MKRKLTRKALVPVSLVLVSVLGFYALLNRQESYSEENSLQELLAQEGSVGYQEKPDGYQEYFHDITVPFGETVSGYTSGYRLRELYKTRALTSVKKDFSDTLIWIPRGPANVGGRTRAIIVDPDDPEQNTWYAGTASGGVWKTDDGGFTWTDLTPDLPNLSTVALAMAPGNHDIIYAGTGEGFGNVGGVTGDGIFVTRDRGDSWEQIESTSGNRDFSYVNKLWVDPEDDSIVIAATNRGIFKTINAGESWEEKYANGYRVQDLRQNPENANTIYAGVNSTGIIKSTDRGETWISSSFGIGNGLRFSLDVSPVDTAVVFTSVETPEATLAVYISDDAGESWRRQKADQEFTNFHGPQGWYNNAIKAHPDEAKSVFVGGVYIGKISFTNELSESNPTVTRVDSSNTASFLDFINFGGAHIGGGMSTGLDEAATVTQDDFVSVEIRFGPGKSQKAHRFLVPDGEGPGVPFSDYEYQDYVDVPFEVWDVTNNRQLMFSFRDQERDGKFNLIIRDPDDPIPGREYMFVSAYDYDPVNPQPEIVNASGNNKGGHFQKLLYFFWPTLAEGGAWDDQNLPESILSVNYGTFQLEGIETTQITRSDVFTSLHVDHHDFQIIESDSPGDDFTILSGNDGGVGVSPNEGRLWGQRDDGFITTQFYGMAKKPGVDQFIGGLQDNGTYLSPSGKTASLNVDYRPVLGGDGFQTLWHPDGRKILASIYNNAFYLSTNSGSSFVPADEGIDGDGPFISKLSFNRSDPDVVFAIGAKGVYKHTEFGDPAQDWELVPIEDGFTLFGNASTTMNVKVSRANPEVVWAGAGVFDDPLLNIFVSTDQGSTFSPVSQPAEPLGYISGMATHPEDDSTAYLLFSYFESPKIFRTTDLGQTWEDISGFGTDTASSTGFPDVTVHDLLVMPHDPNVLWAATEIGIVESLDNGATWNLLESDFPSVSVYQLDFQDGQILLATHGRGIWTAGNFELPEEPDNTSINEVDAQRFTIFPNPADEFVSVRVSTDIFTPVTLTLYSMSGQIILSESAPPLTRGSMVGLNLADVQPGNYILGINTGEEREMQKIVVY